MTQRDRFPNASPLKWFWLFFLGTVVPLAIVLSLVAADSALLLQTVNSIVMFGIPLLFALAGLLIAIGIGVAYRHQFLIVDWVSSISIGTILVVAIALSRRVMGLPLPNVLPLPTATPLLSPAVLPSLVVQVALAAGVAFHCAKLMHEIVASLHERQFSLGAITQDKLFRIEEAQRKNRESHLEAARMREVAESEKRDMKRQLNLLRQAIENIENDLDSDSS